jgi:hypothetical protein
MPRPFLDFVDAGEVPEHLYLEEPRWNLREQGFWLRLATCCARYARLLTFHVFTGLLNGGDCDLEVTEGLRQVCFGR